MGRGGSKVVQMHPQIPEKCDQNINFKSFPSSSKHTNEEGQLDKPINILPPLVLTILYILKFQTQLGLLGNSHFHFKQRFSSAED